MAEVQDVPLLRLHLGCGDRVLDGWVNLDARPFPGVQAWAASDGLRAFGDGSARRVFSEHFWEHVDRGTGQWLLEESFRVLAPGGRIRIATPDLGLHARDYVAGKWDRYSVAGFHFVSGAAFLNWTMRNTPGDAHVFVYDDDELADALGGAGFQMIVRARMGQSTDPEFNGIEGRPDFEDLVFEATRP